MSFVLGLVELDKSFGCTRCLIGEIKKMVVEGITAKLANGWG